MNPSRKKDNFFQFLKRTYGIGKSLSLILCKHLGVNPQSRVKDVPSIYRQDSLKKFMADKIEFVKHNLRKSVELNINKKIKNKSYQGRCFKYHLPTRGQRRRSNARTARRLFGSITKRT